MKLNRTIIFFLIFVFLVLNHGFAAEGNISGDIFGKKRRYIHPSAAINFEYTDNLYNSKEDNESDYSAVFAPSLALSIPGTRRVDININTNTASPGGMDLSRDNIDSSERYLAYLLYSPKFEAYADNDEENKSAHSFKTAAQYNAPGGLTLDIVGQYSDASEKKGEVGKRKSDDYNDVLYDFIATYDISSKFFIKGSFNEYDIEYDLEESKFRNRNDISWSFSTGYRLSPKTNISFQYKRVTVDYEIYDNERNSDEDRFSGNFDWDITAKTTGKLILGQSVKSFDNGNEADDLFAELSMYYNFTTRSGVQLAARRKYYETNFEDSDFYISDRFNLSYFQNLSSRIKAVVNVYWSIDDYKGDDVFQNEMYQVNPGVSYNFNDWLSSELGYTYEKRDSDKNYLDYNTNRFYVNVQGQF